MTNFSAEHLIKCISQKDGNKYKRTASYIKQIEAQNQSIYDIVNQALYSILVGVKYPYMTKFFALRFYRDLFISAQFQLIDGLDQNIIKQIVKASQFNKQVKEKNRGTNYFIEVQKRKKEGDIQKIGNSYVLLATEIVYVSALWYPVDQNNQKTQYAVIYQKLLKMNVPFPTNQKELVFFKQEDKNIFQKNYKLWLQKLPQINQDQEEQTQKNSSSHKTSKVLKDVPLNSSTSQQIFQQKSNQIQSSKVEKNAYTNSDIRIRQNSVRIQIPTQHQKQNSQEALTLTNAIKTKSQNITKKKLNSDENQNKQKQNEKVLLQNKQLKSQIQGLKKEKHKENEEIMKLKKQLDEIKKINAQKDLVIQKYSQEMQKQKSLKQSQKNKESLQIQQKNKQIQNLTKKLKQNEQKYLQESENYQKFLRKCNIQEVKIKKLEKELKQKTNECQEKIVQTDKLNSKSKEDTSNLLKQKVNSHSNSTEALNQIMIENKHKDQKILQINKKYKKQIQAKDQLIKDLELKMKILNQQVSQYKSIVQRITLQNKKLQQANILLVQKSKQEKQMNLKKQKQNVDFSEFCEQKKPMEITMSQYLSKLKISSKISQQTKPLISNNIRQIHSIGKTEKSLQKKRSKMLRQSQQQTKNNNFKLGSSQSSLRFRYSSSHNLYNTFNDSSFLKLTNENKRNQNQFYRTHTGFLGQQQFKTSSFLNKTNSFNKTQSNKKSIKINRKSSTTFHQVRQN